MSAPVLLYGPHGDVVGGGKQTINRQHPTFHSPAALQPAEDRPEPSATESLRMEADAWLDDATADVDHGLVPVAREACILGRVAAAVVSRLLSLRTSLPLTLATWETRLVSSSDSICAAGAGSEIFLRSWLWPCLLTGAGKQVSYSSFFRSNPA